MSLPQGRSSERLPQGATPQDGSAPSEDVAPGSFLGLVVGGSLSEGVEVKLDPRASVEEVPVGSFVTIQGERRRFFGMVSEVRLAATDPSLRAAPPEVADPFVAGVLSGTAVYGAITMRPRLLLPAVAGAKEGLSPARTVPAHFARAFRASEADVGLVFGREDGRHFWVGSPLDMETRVCLDLAAFAQRSNGVFGKSGTGKSFLTRMLLYGVLQSGLASLLVFDMHDEYGWEAPDPARGPQGTVKALKQLAPNKVAVFALDEAKAMKRRVHPDAVVQIGLGEIEPEDILVLRETLNISEAAAETAYSLERHFGKGKWLQEFLALKGQQELYGLAQQINANERALATFHSRATNRFQRMDFLVERPAADSVPQIMEQLDRGNHVVLEFGRYGDDLPAYMLVANLLSRRIYDRYRARKTGSEGAGGTTPLIIVIEEAHRFLDTALASQTIFGSIAREMRKYNVTLLVVDQRPSAIDPEVMSQLGTKVCCLLDDERDVEAVLAGTSGSRELRAVLAGLDSQQQALIFGHAVPIPVAVRVREYGSARSYEELTRGTRARERGTRAKEGGAGGKDEEDELFG